MKILVGSLKYSPIFKSHCCAFGKQCEISGHSVTYMFSWEYAWMLEEDIKKKTIFFGKSSNILNSFLDGIDYRLLRTINQFILNTDPDVIYLHNIHPLNYHIAKFAKARGISFIQHVHEPFIENKAVFGISHQCFLRLFEHLQGKLLEFVDVAVVSSNVAFNLFKVRYPEYSGDLMQIPLMYEDLGKDNIPLGNREYITFIGPPLPVKGPEIFLNIVEHSNEHGLSMPYLLVSRYPIEDRFAGIPNLKHYYKCHISDREMAEILHRSLMTITPYKSARQSSVVLTSYMCGTPVLSSDIGGLREAVQHLRTGYLVDLYASVESWIEGIKYITDNIEDLSKNCRSEFSANYSEVNWQRYLRYVLDRDPMDEPFLP